MKYIFTNYANLFEINFSVLFSILPIITDSNAETDKSKNLTKIITINSDNDNGNKNEFNLNSNITKIEVKDPYNNRDSILKFTKKQKGIYIWKSLNGEVLYVGHSINLYNRISSYFMPSILNTKARRVLRYFNKYGFTEINLTIYIVDFSTSLEELIKFEQHFIDTLNPKLNVDLIASGSGSHLPMSLEIREKLRKERGSPVFIYDSNDFTLLHIFDSKQHMYNSINIHHKTLNNCLDTGLLYLDFFFFSLDRIEESLNIKLLTLDEIKALVKEKRDSHLIKHPAAKMILAEFKDDPNLNKIFNSLGSLAKELKGDRQVIREYLNGTKSGYYRGKWKFTYLNSNID